MEDTTKTLNEKLFEIQSLNLTYQKTAQGYNYKYVPLDKLWDKLLPELKERRLLVTHQTMYGNVITRITNLDGDSSDWIESQMPLPENLDPQKLGSAITYYRRYNLVELFNLMTEDDDDGARAKPTPKKVETKKESDDVLTIIED